MSTTYGLTTTGFVLKPQSQIIAELQQALRDSFGDNINLADESNFGQFVGIVSEREALLWELAQSVYNNFFPAGAEGTSVDNILALAGLRRLPASPSTTNSTPVTGVNGITLYGLVLGGTPGKVVPAGSIIQSTATPPINFTLDADTTINAAVNAVQSLYRNNTPTTGNFSLTFTDETGYRITTPLIPFNALPTTSLLNFGGVPVAGAFTLGMTVGGALLSTASIPFNATAAQIQTAIQAVAGYSAATVVGNFASGFQISWGLNVNPALSVVANTLAVTTSVVDSVQAVVNALFNAVDSLYPFSDVACVVNASGVSFNFGALTPLSGMPATGAKPQPLILVTSNTLMTGSSVTNLSLVNSTVGAPAQGIGSATATVTGVNFVGANTLTVIGSPAAGWTSVTNQLDCLTGTIIETDTAALIRRDASLQSKASGPLGSIIDKVRAVTGVTSVIGFQNLFNAALQIISFPIVPISGSYQLLINGSPTSTLAFNASAGAVQAAIRAISGFSNANVTGSLAAGFTVDFNGSLGGQAIPQIVAVDNTTGGAIVVTFGRPGNSFEIVAEGGSDLAIATAIYSASPAGIESFGSTPITVFDQFGNPFVVSFSRPTPVPIYVTISLVTDLLTASQPKFNPQSIATIQQNIITIGREVGIGGLVIGFGTNGLIGAFNGVPGINSYTLFFDRTPNPSINTPLQVLPEEVPDFESFLVAVSYV